MTVETEKSRVARLVLAAVDAYKPSGDLDVALFRVFARATIDRIRGPFLAQHPPRTVLRYLEDAFRFAAVRKPGDLHAEVRRSPARGLLAITHMADQPFIVDTVRLFYRRHKADYRGGFNVILDACRDDEGRLVGIGGDDAVRESLAMLEGEPREPLADLDGASAALTHALVLAAALVRDFRAMTRIAERMVERCEVLADRQPDQAFRYAETAAFLKWLLHENFVFMGVSYQGEDLGIQAVPGPYHGERSGPWTVVHQPGTVAVRKASVESPVHRAGRIDELLLRLHEDDPAEEGLFLRGLFTYRAVTQPSRNVPILRGVLREELQAQQATPGTFRYKGIANVFDSLPTEFLFTTPREAISEMIDLVLDSEQQQEVGVTVLTSPDASAFCLVSMPKGEYSDDLRRDVERRITEGLGATYADHGLFMGRYDTVLLHFYLTGIVGADEARVTAITEQIRLMATPIENRLWEVIAEREGEERADYLVDTYGAALPKEYVRQTPVDRIVRDLEQLDALAGQDVRADVFEEEGGGLVLRVYQARDVYLTEVLPVLDNFGLVVRSSDVTSVRSRGGHLSFDSFRLAVDEVRRKQVLEHASVLCEALPRILHGDVDNDVLNELVLTAGLEWQAVDVLRGYAHYLRQIGVRVAVPRLRAIMLTQPELCRSLIQLFRAKFSTRLEGEREPAIAAAREHLSDGLRKLRTHDEDLVFRRLANLVEATVRTNVYRTDRVRTYVSFKFDARRVLGLEGQRPLFEIYVHCRDIEGVHLRFGRVARGGLRWSDRADYRTEVLGLVTTQQVKNVVIVPEGSKGGFYLPRPKADPRERREQADDLYQIFIRGLLDLTDNVVEGEVVRPPMVVCHDPPDPYLVVAADKGTAHLSDTANRLSEAYGFWLGDAFASGGSNGYDHKGVGITARGAWVLVRRHFAEMGRDPYASPFTAVGVGDMGGDVFGNGLIESPHTRLLAAFNHVHIFLDPNPDPAASFGERKRLFEVAGREAGWDHYDPSLISEGGGVFDRTSKSIPLAPAVREMLGIDAEEAPPEDVITAILRMDVDLLWSGGIGTYVKASFESHDDADDRSNDRFRVNANELRCRIIGEGANLSLTAAGRIEAALHGVRLNADFIDNSGGVDLSDHEVNLKILLSGPTGRGDLSTDDRNALLHRLTEEVAGLVLANNDVQGRQISRDVIRSRLDVFPFGRAIAFVERHFGVAREDLHLPSEDTLAERAAADLGLTRPELAMLSSWVKRFVFSALMASRRAREITGYGAFLRDYFPGEIRDRFLADIDGHQLADEIAMTMATTRIVGDAGAAFVPLALETTGRDVFEVCDAYLRAQQLARATEVRATLEELRTTVSLSALYRAWVEVDAGAREVIGYWLAAGQRMPTDDELAEMEDAVDQVYALQADAVTRANQAMMAEMRGDDIPEPVAALVLKAQYLNIALMVWSHAKKLGVSFPETVVRQLAVGRASRLQEIIDQLSRRHATGRWEPIATQILVLRFSNLLRELVLRLGTSVSAASVDALEPVLATGPVKGVREQVDQLLEDGEAPPLATLIVLEERLAGAIGRL